MFSVYPIPSWWLREYIDLSYYHHRIGSMNYYPLFMVRSWNNGMRCMFLHILILLLINLRRSSDRLSFIMGILIPVRRRLLTAWFVTRFNLWLRHDLWPQNASICDLTRFVTKSASICDQRYTMILESKLCRGKLVFVFTLITYATWYNMMHIYRNYAMILI